MVAPEPPADEEQTEVELHFQVPPPYVNYHHQEMHCPYTGRCPVPSYPVPPPAAPPEK